MTQREYCNAANRATFTAVLLESREGIENLEAILAVPGLDYVGIGTNDLALSFAVGGHEPRAPELSDVIERARTRIKTAGKPIVVVSTREQAQEAAALGAGLVAVPDVVLIEVAGREFLAASASARPATPSGPDQLRARTRPDP
jgi:4-hydroxy-2-oxoheptanedioate aldolase